jgi:hypothetical protein
VIACGNRAFGAELWSGSRPPVGPIQRARLMRIVSIIGVIPVFYTRTLHICRFALFRAFFYCTFVERTHTQHLKKLYHILSQKSLGNIYFFICIRRRAEGPASQLEGAGPGQRGGLVFELEYAGRK